MIDRPAFSTEVSRLIDEGIETLRWCRQHSAERGAAEKLRRLQISLGALALALDYEMEAEASKARLAMEKADWQPRLVLPYDPHATGDLH